MAFLCAVDVGTRSARAGIFGTNGECLGRDEQPIALDERQRGHAAYNSADIWRAVCLTVRSARQSAGIAPDAVVGIGFDATCSLVILDQLGAPLSVSDDDARWDTIAWFDHRAMAEAAECTATGHPVLAYVGGSMSPEMQTPKAMWLKRNLPGTWHRLGHLFDLPDFLTWRASGNHSRSQCTLVSKWPYLAHEASPWQADFLESVGLEDLLEKSGLPERAAAVGADLGPLSMQAAGELGLTQRCRVATGLVDAFAGALSVFGAKASSPDEVALIAGTSSCVMSFSAAPQFRPAFWGPYFEATLPGLWMAEGGQSATGALLDHLIHAHAAGGEPTAKLHAQIAARVAALREREGPSFAAGLHVLPDFHGNRTPLADPSALGVVSGLSLDASFDGLCRLYWRACVGIALGLRHILEAMAKQGAAIRTLHVTGGHVRNPLLTALYADATGCKLVTPKNDEAMLLGTAMVAATASGLVSNLAVASQMMRFQSEIRYPDASQADLLDRDYRVFIEMHRHRQALEAIV